MTNKYVIEGNCVTPQGIIYQQIELCPASKTISKIAKKISNTPNYTTQKNDLIFPGFVDIHVHAREDLNQKANYKEDFKSVTQAAYNGGVVALMDMPNTYSPPIDLNSWQNKCELIKEKTAMEIIPYIGVGPLTYPIHGYQLPYKVYMGPSIGELFFHSLEELDTVLARYEGKHISFHCEDPTILKHNQMATNHHQRRPPEAEIVAIKNAIALTKKYKLHTIICHLSTQKGFELIAAAQQTGLDIKMEVTPHHLYFDQELLTEKQSILLQVNPPLRSRQDRLFLLQQLKQGNIDFLATDHAPHSLQEKQQGISGVTGLDTFGDIVGDLITHHQINPVTMLQMACTNPGSFINNFTKKCYGLIAPGYSSNLTIIRGDYSHQCTTKSLRTKNKHNPFLGKYFSTHTVLISHQGEQDERSDYN